jgi:hypothetical protein
MEREELWSSIALSEKKGEGEGAKGGGRAPQKKKRKKKKKGEVGGDELVQFVET